MDAIKSGELIRVLERIAVAQEHIATELIHTNRCLADLERQRKEDDDLLAGSANG